MNTSLHPGATTGFSAGFGTVRLWGMSRILWFYLCLNGLYVAGGIGLVIGGLVESNGTAPLITGIIISVFAIPITALMLGLGARPLVITNGVLRVPKAFGSTDIPLSTLSGVGLIYQYTPGSRNPSGWTLRVWDDKKEIPVRRWIVVAWTNTSAPGMRKRLFSKRDWSLPLAHEDSAYLASTKAGQVARRIYDAALGWQGQYGPLTTKAMQRGVVYNPNAMTHLAAWWSPDGTMGRASDLPPFDPANTDLAASSPSRRGRAVLLALAGTVASLLVGVGVGNIDGAAYAMHPDGAQDGVTVIATIILVAGIVFSLVIAVRMWRRPRKAAAAFAQSAGPSPAFGWGGPSAVQSPEHRLPEPSANPIAVPQASPEVRRARRRIAGLTLASLPLFIVGGVVTSLMLGHVGHVANGEVCSSVLGPPSLHPSAACNTWRHHQLMIFIWPATILVIGVVTFLVLEVRAMQVLQRISRAAPGLP